MERKPFIADLATDRSKPPSAPQPIRLKAEKRQQAGFDIFVAHCACGLPIALNGLGKIQCQCGRPLEFIEE